MKAPGPSSRWWAVAAASAVLALAGCSSSSSSASAARVLARPWPERMTPGGEWSASESGTGDRVTLTVAGTITGGLGRTTVSLGTPTTDEPTNGRALVLPGGETWYPQEPFRLEGEGDVPFSSLTAEGKEVRVPVAIGALLAGAGEKPVVAHGSFLGSDGRRVDDLPLPPGTTVASACQSSSCPSTETEPAGDDQVTSAKVEATAGMVVHGAGDGEAAVAGAAHVEAEGRAWDGLVTAIEGGQVDGTATYDGHQWSLTAHADGARQVWVDGWPVADTVLEARSYSVAPGFFDRGRLLKVEWTNVGHATAQVLEAEGTGPGAPGVGFDINNTQGHDAGLGVRRGDQVSGFRDGADIDSNLPPGGRTNRELSYESGLPATLVLRGNFPEVRVDLAVPGT